MADCNSNPRARVFISCGQNRITDEAGIAREIYLRLEQLGFDPYIAIQEQTLRGLKENIFEQLRNSEYFVFVDFKREELGRKEIPEHRGSLFSHQELAIASYLDIPCLILQEQGVRQRDGILFCLQANVDLPFVDRSYLPNIVADKVQRSGWSPNWRNDLFLERQPHAFVDAYVRDENRMGRFFVIDVRNRHRHKTANNCYAYLESASKIDPPKLNFQFKTCEKKWAGYVLPNAHIPPGGVRGFDALWVPHDAPDELRFQMFADSTEYIPHIKGKGTYKFEYTVLADQFSVARCIATLELDGSTLPTTLTLS